MKFAHVINPVNAPQGSDLAIAQPITFEAIKRARQFCEGQPIVELYSVSFPEDHATIPAFFTKLPDLERSVLDIAPFTIKRKYPLLLDILKSVYHGSDADFLIFTNMDISPMPHFYTAINRLLSDESDALIINRRGIPGHYKSPEDLPLMYAEFGEPHPGFDCFVFKRELLSQFILEDICVGVPFIEVSLTHNLIAFAKKLKLVDNLHLTFHIGREVMPPINPEFYTHNRREYETKIYPLIKPLLNIDRFPYAGLPLYKRIIKWGLNPSFRTHQVVEMEGKAFTRRLKFKLDQLRFRLLDRLR
jgi:hypothetical protein